MLKSSAIGLVAKLCVGDGIPKTGF